MGSVTGDTVFFTMVKTAEDSVRARLLVESLRTFGGPFADSRVMVFATDPAGSPWTGPQDDATEVHNLDVPEGMKGYILSEKVCACAEAERLAAGTTGSLVWLSSDTLVVAPPAMYELGLTHDAAFRPVHIQNVGLPATSPVDAFWRRVCDAVWLSDIDQLVESFVDGQMIRAYFNSHSFSVNPTLGLMAAWRDSFEEVVNDREFQEGACADELHKVFLHQAVLSAVVVKSVLPGRLRILPPDYSYPYNLHGSVSEARRAKSLNDLVTVVYEGLSVYPEDLVGIDVSEPLRSWLSSRVPEARPRDEARDH